MGIVFGIKNLSNVRVDKTATDTVPNNSSKRLLKPLTLKNKLFLRSLPGFTSN